MVLYSKFTDGFQFSGEKNGLYIRYSNSRDTGEFMRFFLNTLYQSKFLQEQNH